MVKMSALILKESCKLDGLVWSGLVWSGLVWSGLGLQDSNSMLDSIWMEGIRSKLGILLYNSKKGDEKRHSYAWVEDTNRQKSAINYNTFWSRTSTSNGTAID